MMYRSESNRFPYLREFVEFDLPKIPQRKPHVFEKFCEYGEMSNAEGKLALRYGTYPILNVRRQDPFGEYDYTQKSSKTRGNIFNIAERLAVAFEFSHTYQNLHLPDDPAGELIPKTLKGEARLLLEAIILHEIVHWGDYKKDTVHGYAHDGMLTAREMGNSFERAAYGKKTLRPSQFKHLEAEFPFLWEEDTAAHAH